MYERIRDVALAVSILTTVSGLLALLSARRLGSLPGSSYYRSAAHQLLPVGAVTALGAILGMAMP